MVRNVRQNKKIFYYSSICSRYICENNDLSILVFTSGGGGINIKGPNCIISASYFGLNRELFIGNKGDIDLPLIYLPQFPSIDIEKDIYCSFKGRFDTILQDRNEECLQNVNKIKFYDSVNFETYKTILNSILH